MAVIIPLGTISREPQRVRFVPRPADARRSFAGAAFLASAVVHAAAFVALGPFATSGARVPAASSGPVVVSVALAPWPAVAHEPFLERNASPAATRPPARRPRAAPDRKAALPLEAAAPEPAEGIAMPESPFSDGPPAAATAPVAMVAAAASAATPAPAVLVPAAYLHTPEPGYPAAAREEGEEGVVLLRVRISRDGLPAEIVLDRSSGFTALDRAAIAGVKRWSFTPARRGDESIEAWMRIPIRFRLG